MNVVLLALTSYDLWVMTVAVCAAISCAIPGCFLVLRRMSLLGDAISHAILPGLALAFLITSSRNVWTMLAGALVAGVLTTLFTAGLARIGRIAEDAAMGIVFTVMFAAGVLLITLAAQHTDLDPGCVLYGLIEGTPLITVPVLGFEIPRAALVLATVAVATIVLVVLFYRPLKIVSFDPALAASLGLPVRAIHYGLMVVVAVVAVACFEAVGSILVVAMLIAPPAAAHLLTDRLPRMIVISALLGVASAIIGYAGAVHWDTSVAGMMSVVAGLLFVLAVLLAPRYGVIAKIIVRARLSLRIAAEDSLAMLYRWHERSDEPTPLAPPAAFPGARSDPRPLGAAHIAAALGQPLRARLALLDLRRRGQVVLRFAPSGEISLALTPAGIDAARLVVRSHRLWERYLAKHLGLAEDHLHAPAHRAEHYIKGELAGALAHYHLL